MADVEVIRSSSNPALKRVRSVNAGREPNVLLLEGDRLVDEARRQGLDLELCLVAEERSERASELEASGVPVKRIEAKLLSGISRLVQSPGILALAQQPDRGELAEFEFTDDALVVVAAGIADPGNLGGLARTAEAAGASAIVAISGGARLWNEKAVRGSMGTLLRLPAFGSPSAEAARDVLDSSGFRHVRAATRGGTRLTDFDWSGRVALWLSSETGDLPELAESFEGVTISMATPIESLNVAAAAAVLLFVAGRVDS